MPTRQLIGLALAALAVGLVLVGGATGIAAAATVIETPAAALDYQNVNGTQQPTVLSNIVRILVTQPAPTPDIQVTPSSASRHGGPGETVYYTVTIANKGDGSDSYRLALSSIVGWPARMLDDGGGGGGGIAGDGIHQPYEENIIYETTMLPPGETFSCFCAVEIPVDAQEGDGDFTMLTVSSASSPAVQTSAAFTTEATLAPLKGQVTDRVTGHPLSGAVVNVYQDDVWVDTTLTLAPYGVYEFGRELLPGVYRVSANYPGYVQQKRWEITITEATTAYTNFFLDFGYPEPGLSRLGGQVLDAVTQRAIVGASVLVYLGDQLVAQTATGGQGLYDILNLPPGVYVVQIVADGYVADVRSNVRLVADEATILDCFLNAN